MGLLEALFPKEKDFYKMLELQSSRTLEGINLFVDYMCGVNNITEKHIDDIEHEADGVRRLLIDDLNKTFITPIEREDLFGLSRAIDDILDLAKSTVEEFNIYSLTPNKHLKEQSQKVHEGVTQIHEAVTLLKEHPAVSIERCMEAKDAVDEGETLYFKALKELTELDDIKYMFKMREIYKHMLSINSRVADAANIILDVIVKTT